MRDRRGAGLRPRAADDAPGAPDDAPGAPGDPAGAAPGAAPGTATDEAGADPAAAADPALHPAMRAALARIAALADGAPSRYALPFPQARAQLLAQRRWWQEGAPAASWHRDRVQTTAGPVDIARVASAHADPRRLLVYLHGGGWCIGSSDTHAMILRRFAHASGATVIGVDYPLAPEHPFPAAARATGAVVDALLRDAPAGCRFALAGDSAGANLALVEAIRRRDAAAPAPACLLLYYGVYGPHRRTRSVARLGDGRYGLSAQALRRYEDAYLGGRPAADPAAFPLLACLERLPPMLLVAAELDPLLDDSRALQRRLRRAGSRVALRREPGLVHGFLSYGRMLPQVDASIDEAAAFLQGSLAIVTP